MEKVLRIATRKDNYYKYEVETECWKLNSSELESLRRRNNELDSIGFGKVRKVIYDFDKKVGCSLKGGFTLEFLLEIAQFLGARIQLVSDVSEYEFENTAPSGRVDMYVASYVLKASRVKIVDPTFVVGGSRLKAFVNNEFEGNSGDSLTLPFQISLWLGLLGISAISLVAIFLLYNTKLFYSRRNLANLDFGVLFDGITIILQKGSDKLMSSSDSVKIAAVVTSFCFLMVLVTFSGCIVAIISFPIYTVNSFPALVNSKYKILMERGYGNGSSSELNLKKMRSKDRLVDRFLLKASQSNIPFDTYEDAIRKVEKGPVAFIAEDESAFAAMKSTIGEFPCTWSKFIVKDIQYPWSMYMWKGFQYRYQVNAFLLKMEERGLAKRIRIRWMPRLPNGVCQPGPVVVKIPDIRSAFYSMLLGILFSVIVLAVESILSKIICQNLLN